MSKKKVVLVIVLFILIAAISVFIYFSFFREENVYLPVSPEDASKLSKPYLKDSYLLSEPRYVISDERKQVEFSLRKGVDVVAPFDGVIQMYRAVTSQQSLLKDGGYYVYLDASDRRVRADLYVFKGSLNPKLKEGDEVKRGQKIAKAGETMPETVAGSGTTLLLVLRTKYNEKIDLSNGSYWVGGMLP